MFIPSHHPNKPVPDVEEVALAQATATAAAGANTGLATLEAILKNNVQRLGPTSAPGATVHLDSGSFTLFPDIPTLAELGYRGNLTRVYFGLVAPAGTPKAIIDKIREDVARIGSDPGFRKKQFIDRALEPILSTPEEFARFLAADRATSERVVKEAGAGLQPQ